MTTYGLLPGACHGPWCWTTTIAALKERGYRAIAIDLPGEDVTAGFDRYVEVTRAAVDGAHGRPREPRDAGRRGAVRVWRDPAAPGRGHERRAASGG
jgi:alpha-beta hydrolase superfamily lysophospholipase